MNLRNSEFARWLLRQCHLAGHDTAARDTHITIIIYASIALDEGLNAEEATDLARYLGVTPQEVTNAYTDEWRQRATASLLAHPDLAELDARLDRITGQRE
ncbi:hypothetical protein [Streptomyces sp. NPDC021622]|uniref:hypothetical protein n=1 Tax=Streptomyces sp. NPDC021622 TaxID=3155013 RepID=UPI0033CCD780